MKKVTLLELVATKIIYAVLLALYYWMFARRDWHDYYSTLQNVVAIAAGELTSFALMANGGVYACGSISYGQF
mgnify:CR=1 FL=1